MSVKIFHCPDQRWQPWPGEIFLLPHVAHSEIKEIHFMKQIRQTMASKTTNYGLRNNEHFTRTHNKLFYS